VVAVHGDKRERARIASRVCYRIRLLRRHGLIRKVKNQRRYHITPQGRPMLAAILTAQHATVQQLNALAA
jgi:DNA-binding PadR family transcriptional regulator